MSEYLLSVRHLVKHFRTRGSSAPLVAVGDVSIEVEVGETLALVGESGSGKSTVGRVIAGLEMPTAGQVIFKDRDIGKLKRSHRRGLASEIQMVFQDPADSFDPRMTMGSSLIEPLVAAGCNREEAIARVGVSLTQVQLPEDALMRFPHELSSGLLQQAALARALSVEPELVILDEPTSALDVRARRRLMDILLRLKEVSRLASILISHDLNSVRSAADRVAVMYLGEIVEVSATKQLFEDPQHPYTQALLSAVPLPDPQRRDRLRIRLSGEIPSPSSLPAGCYLRSRCPKAIDVCNHQHPELLYRTDLSMVRCHLASDEHTEDLYKVSPRSGDAADVAGTAETLSAETEKESL